MLRHPLSPIEVEGEGMFDGEQIERTMTTAAAEIIARDEAAIEELETAGILTWREAETLRGRVEQKARLAVDIAGAA